MNEVNEMYNLDVEFHRCPILFTFFFFAVSEEMVLAVKIWRCFLRIILPFHIYFLVVPKMEMFASCWMWSESISFFQQWIGMLLHLLDPRYTPKHTKIRVRGISSFMFQVIITTMILHVELGKDLAVQKALQWFYKSYKSSWK